MRDELENLLDGCKIIPLTKNNFENVMEVYKTNREFFILTDSKEARLESCINDIDAIPPGLDVKNRLFAGVWKDGNPIAVLDVLLGFPAPKCVWIGFLLVHGGLHGMGLGSKITAAVTNSAKSAGYEAIQLGVIQNNTAGIGFWQRQGFGKIRESKTEHAGSEAVPIVVMEKRIVPV